MSTRTPLFALLGRSAFSRIYTFRNEALTLWRAFWHPDTPLHLKAATVFAALYLVSWIVKMLPPHVTGNTINGTARRR